MNISHLKLGKQPHKPDPLGRTLKFATYSKALAPAPVTAGWVKNVKSYPMYGNDTLGDCVPAAMAHAVQRWTDYAGKAFTPTLDQVIAAYSAVGGYVPGDPSTDNGCDPLAALKYWRTTGLGGHKIAAFVSVDPTNAEEVKQAISLFGGTFIGLQLPISAQTPVTGANGLPCWSKPSSLFGSGASGSWGGHMVDGGAYGVDAKGNGGLAPVTWGQIYDMAWDFLATYGDGAYAIVTQDWIEADGKSPSGFNTAELLADLKLVTA